MAKHRFPRVEHPVEEQFGGLSGRKCQRFLALTRNSSPNDRSSLDKGRLTPAVDIKDPQHPEWTLLSYFGVITKGDIHYYLRCLIAISEEHRPDVDNVAYIYENIQARYKENEELIRYVWHGVVRFFKALTISARHSLRETLSLSIRSH